VFDTSCPSDSAYWNIFHDYTTLGCSISGTTNLLATDPLFCNERESTVKRYSLRIDSPAVAANNSWNVDIGKTDGVECAWGSIARNTTVGANVSATVLEDVIVPSNKILTLKSGSTLKFDRLDQSNVGSVGSTALTELSVSGKLKVEGTNSSQVSLKPLQTDSLWYGVTVSSSGKLFAEFASVANAKYGIVSTSNDSIKVEKSVFDNGKNDDIYIDADPNYVLISRNVINVKGSRGIRVDADSMGYVTISNNKITGTSTALDGILLAGLTGSATVSTDTVTAFSTGAGIHININNPICTNNRVTDNKYGFHVDGGAPQIGTTSSSSDNAIIDNTRGIFVDGVGTCESVNTINPTIRNNLIESNTYGVVTERTVNANMGSGILGDKGLNSIINNDTYCIWNRANSSCGSIQAHGNYFGSCTGGLPPICWSGLVTVGTSECTQPASGRLWAIEVVGAEPILPVRLMGIRPNPVSASALIQFGVAEKPQEVGLSIYDISGRLVRELANDTYQPGVHDVWWDGYGTAGEVTAGLYFVRITSGSGILQTSKIMVVR
jgi:hypothetical protein